MTSRTPRCTFIPPYLLRALGREADLLLDGGFRATREVGPRDALTMTPEHGPAWVVHTAAGATTLPGEEVRRAGEPDSGDAAVDEAATGVAAALALFEEAFGRRSYDGEGATVSLTVHYGRDYANAFWDGTQLVFGDGDDEVFTRFTAALDVLGHELGHAVTERTAGLVYRGQSGALNESLSDVFAACSEQRARGRARPRPRG